MILDRIEDKGIIINRDCLEVMPRLIAQGINVDAIITDIPYGTTQCKWDSIIPFDKMWECLNQLIKDNGVICLFGNEPFSSDLRISNRKMYRYDWIWHKSLCSNFFNAKKQPFFKVENICVFYKKQPTYNPQMIDGKPYKIKEHYVNPQQQKKFGKENKMISFVNDGTRYPDNVININNEQTKYHPTQKPVALMEYLIKTYTNENNLVLDFTMGSGTTCVACLNTNRKFIGIEK